MTGPRNGTAPQFGGSVDPFTVPPTTHAVGDAPNRRPIVVHGELTRVDAVQWAGGPVLEALLWDGTGSLTLVFLGRQAVGAVEPGRQLTAAGVVGWHHGRRVVLNPAIWLDPVRPVQPPRSDEAGDLVSLAAALALS